MARHDFFNPFHSVAAIGRRLRSKSDNDKTSLVMLTLKSLSPCLVADLRTVRLRALQDTQSAFGRTYAEESQLSEADWLRRVAAWSSCSV
jgi:hypothetical protein